MINIDEIMEMLDWNQPEEIQRKGRELARQVKTLNAFLQPYYNGKSKSLWDNCAIILAEKSDDELEPYSDYLLDWLQDLNWPGALTIFNRLKKMNSSIFIILLNDRIKISNLKDDQIWKENLQALYDARRTANK